MATENNRVPKCLTDQVISHIWQEVFQTREESGPVIEAIIKGLVLPTDKTRFDFIQCAMEFPHFAHESDLAEYFQVDQRTARRWMLKVIEKARLERNVSTEEKQNEPV